MLKRRGAFLKSVRDENGYLEIFLNIFLESIYLEKLKKKSEVFLFKKIKNKYIGILFCFIFFVSIFIENFSVCLLFVCFLFLVYQIKTLKNDIN